MVSVETRTRVCPGCGSTNVGMQGVCARCATPLGPPPRPKRSHRRHLRRALTTLTLLPGLAGGVFTVWQLTHPSSRRATTSAATSTAAPALPATPTTVSLRAPVTSAMTAQSCANGTGAYTAHYPAGWVTESATSAQACHFFAMLPFRVTAQDVAGGDVTIDTSTTASYDSFVATFDQPGDASIILKHTPLTINGHRAQQMDYTMHEGPRTLYAYGYVIEHGGRPLVIATAAQNARSAQLQQVVTAMAKGLELR